ncbi:MAG TPA: hypothetical protein PLG34_04580 [Spirochaetota bacterium]|jgi:thiamine-phosphate pyrophosphorylase|nr:MAG: thiamine-phosphate pyrophosphorylase [Spirochaetes bacterium ADurb.Bin133]HNZ26916.1 hypothetical protein [Spirochaetota bacterium]HPY87238.1 hypothetical protein [Spirochaetota bacterium]
MKRIIDANINRVCEGLRVIEDICRFELSRNEYAKELKAIRHFIRKKLSINNLYLSVRDSINDGGRKYQEIEGSRSNVADLLKANFLRVEEGLRVLEETSKVDDFLRKYISEIKKFRFDIYSLEKNLLLSLESSKISLKKVALIKAEISSDFDKIINNLEQDQYNAIEIEPIDISKLHLLKMAEYLQRYAVSRNITLILRNSLDISLTLNNSAMTADSSYLPLEYIKKTYKGKVGFFTKINEFDNIKENFDFYEILLEESENLKEDLNKIFSGDVLNKVFIFDKTDIDDKYFQFNLGFYL